MRANRDLSLLAAGVLTVLLILAAAAAIHTPRFDVTTALDDLSRSRAQPRGNGEPRTQPGSVEIVVNGVVGRALNVPGAY